MAKKIFTAEELGFAPATQNIFTAEELGLAAPKQKDIFTAEELFGAPPPKAESAGFSTSDLGVAFAEGVIGSTKAATDVAGATNVASQSLGDIQKDLSKQYSPERQAEMQRQAARMKAAEESGSTMAEIKAGALNVLESPLQSTAQAVGSFVPYLPAMFAAPAAAVLGLGTRAVAAITAVARQAPKAMATAQGAGAVKGAIYDGVYQAEIEAGVSPELAKQKAEGAQEYFGSNFDQIAIGTGIGLLTGSTGVEKLLTPASRAGISKNIGRRVATTTVTEAIPEGVQEGQERLAQNLALQREGYDVDTFAGVAGGATQGALMGALASGPIAAVLPPGSGPAVDSAPPPPTEEEKTRFAELNAISSGTKDQITTDENGNQVKVPGQLGRYFTSEEQAEYQKLKQKLTPETTTTPPPTEVTDKQFLDLVTKYQQQGFTAVDAEKLANEDFKELGYGDQLIARASKPGISVSGEPSGTIPGTTGIGRTDLAAPSTTAGVAGSGETTELNTLAAELKAKYNLTDEQALKNAEESLRQKQFAKATSIPLQIRNQANTEALNIFNVPKTENPDGTTTYGSATPAVQKQVDAYSLGAYDAAQGFDGAKFAAGMKGKEKKAYEAGFIFGQKAITPTEVTPTEVTPTEVTLTDTTDTTDTTGDTGDTDITGDTDTTTTSAKSRGRPKTKRTPEEIVAAQELRRQQSAVGRTAINDINKVTKILSQEFDAEADFANETEARDALYEFNNKRQAALEIAHRISVDPNQKNKTAGTRAKELLAKATPQEAENAKLRHETRQKTKAAAPTPTLDKEDTGSFGRAITAQDLKDQQQLEATRRRLELQKPISIFTEAFKKWFGKSKIVNKDGTPKKMYHGTARDIDEFQPKQANAIFLTEDPKFAEGFTYQSEDWMATELDLSLSKEAKTALLEEAGKISEEKNTDVLEEYRNLLKNQLESRKNIIPVYVRAEMPFDYENPDHIDFVIAALTPEEEQTALSNVSYDPNRLVKALQQGAWVHIESAPIQAAMRRVGFDGFYVREGGNKNLAVYNSNQIKSVFNQTPTEDANISRAEALIDEATNRNNNPKYNTFANATQAINWVAKNGNVFEKFLANRIAPFLQGVKLVIVDDISQVPKRFQVEFEGAAGLYYESKSGRTIYLDRASGINNTIFLHEALHGATMARINRFIKDFSNDVAIPKKLEDAMLEMHRTMFAAKDRLEALKQLGIADDRVLALEKAGAFDDVKEFVAYGMSHPDMQEFLMQTKGVYAGEATESSLFNKFVQGIRKFFEMGAEHKSAMQDLIIITNKLLNAPNEAITQEDTAAAKKTTKKAEAIDKNLEKLRLSNNAKTAIEDIDKLIQEHGSEGYIDLMKARFDDMGSGFISKLLFNLQTVDIIRWVGDKIPALKKIDDLQNEMAAMRARLLASSAKKADELAAFIRKNGSVVLSDTMHLARLERISPTQYTDVTAALTNDPVIKHYLNLIADPNKTVEQKASYKGKITSRSKAITKMYAQWDKLGKQKGGHDMYIMVREFYKDNYTATRTLLDEQINAMNIDAAAKVKLLKSVRLMQEQTLSGEDKELDGMKQSAIPEDYFPLKRDGKYWLRVAKGPTGREFYLFPSGAARNLFLTRRAKELGLDKNDGSMFSKGDDINSLRKDFQDSSLMLQEIFANIETITTDPKYDTSKYESAEAANAALKEELKDQIYQTYLMTMPERSFRKQFLHAEKITGFSADVLQNFKTSATSYANQLSKLKYGVQLSNELQNARDSLTPEYRVPEKPLPTDERAKLELFINEMAKRTGEELNPPEEGQVVTRINQFAFLMLLTSGASAATQMASVPIMVMPTFNAEYGYGASAKAFAKYSQLWKSMGVSKKEANGDITFTAPSMGSSKMVQSSPVLKRAFEAASEKYNLFQLTNTSIITNRARTPDSSYESKIGAGLRIGFNAMTAMFSGSERMSREITYMMAFELEYAKTKDFDAAVQKAVDTTHEVLGRYDNFNRPRILRNAIGRTVGQFKQYAVFMTSWFVRNGYSIIRLSSPIEERAEAMHRLSGVLVMGGLFHGLVGMPLYSVICSTIDAVLNNLGDDEEERRRRAVNPLTADDSNLRFRYEFLPRYFGEITVPGLDGRQHRLNELLEKGPISALTDMNIGSRTSFDGMWFREAKPGKNYVETMQNYLIANLGPGVSTGFNMIGGIEDLNNGHIGRGLEKLVPALFKGSLVAERMREEGAETRGGADLLKKSELNELNYVASVIGFSPTRLARIQEKNFQYQKQIIKATDERTKLLRRLDETIMDPENKGKGEDIKDIFKNIAKFNKRYPAERFLIEPDDIERSLEAYAKKRGMTIRGQYIDEKLAPYLMKPTKAVTPLQ